MRVPRVVLLRRGISKVSDTAGDDLLSIAWRDAIVSAATARALRRQWQQQALVRDRSSCHADSISA
jgi:hypothetical protein